MNPVIRVDEEVMETLKQEAVKLGLVFEPPNTTLRKILRLDPKETIIRERSQEPKMRNDVRRRILEFARKEGMLTYGQLMREFHLARGRHIANVLGIISEYEAENGRPYLSSIVTRADTGKPSPDFWGIKGISKSRTWEEYRDDVHRFWKGLTPEQYQELLQGK
jgi:hypothetical protein